MPHKPYSTTTATLKAQAKKHEEERQVIRYNGKAELVLRSLKDLYVLKHLRGDVADVG